MAVNDCAYSRYLGVGKGGLRLTPVEASTGWARGFPTCTLARSLRGSVRAVARTGPSQHGEQSAKNRPSTCNKSSANARGLSARQCTVSRSGEDAAKREDGKKRIEIVTNVESLGGTPIPTNPPWQDHGDHLFRMRCEPNGVSTELNLDKRTGHDTN